MFYTTLNHIYENVPCTRGWGKLLKSLKKKKADDEPLSLLQIIDSNGIYDAIWALRAINDCPEIRLFAVRCARQVQYLMGDERSLNALDVAERFAIGEATKHELLIAEGAAWAAWSAGSAVSLWDAAAREPWAAALAAVMAIKGEALAAAKASRLAAWEEREAAREAAKETQESDFRAIFCSED